MATERVVHIDSKKGNKRRCSRAPRRAPLYAFASSFASDYDRKKVDSHGSPARRTGRDGARWGECIGLSDAFFFFGIESDSRAEKGESIADLRLVGHVFYALNSVETAIDGNVGTDEPVEVIAGAIEFPNESPSATRHLTLDGWIDLDRVDDDEIIVCQGRWSDEFRPIALFDELFAERLERLRIVGIGLRHET